MHATSDMFVSIQAIDWIDRYNTLRVNEEVLNRSLSRILFTALPSCHCCIYRLHRHPNICICIWSPYQYNMSYELLC